MLIADCGTTWSKIRDTDDGRTEIISTRELIGRKDLRFELATGHSAKGRCRVYRNELVALAEGGRETIGEADFSLVDVGGRDIKFVRFRDGRLDKLDWNLACGSTTGATVELLGAYYGIDFSRLSPPREWINVTCGVFGMEQVLERVSLGADPGEAVAIFLHGLVRNVFSFSGRPESLYLSGGFCENQVFVRTMESYCKVVPLGRTVPLSGLSVFMRSEEYAGETGS